MAKQVNPFSSYCVVGEVDEDVMGAAAKALLLSGASRVTITGNFKPGHDPEHIEAARRLLQKQPQKALPSPDHFANGDQQLKGAIGRIFLLFQRRPGEVLASGDVKSRMKLSATTVSVLLNKLKRDGRLEQVSRGKFKLRETAHA